ncbi:MAG: glycosyltransferase family 2 protein [Chloroflexota bacterium]|nr:glycosyltransferase family 2 protein [Chloroflexota bacterium]
MSGARTLSVIVPAYNESHSIEGVVANIKAAAARLDGLEILIVDDGSTDDTGQIADELAAKHAEVSVIHHPRNRGFAAAYGSGLARARLRYVTFLPGDNEVALGSITNIFSAVGTADLVVPYHATPWNRTWYRRILTWICVTEINVLFGWHVKYTQGNAVYPTELARVLPITTGQFFFITEMLVHALVAGYSFVHVPLTHQERTYGRSKALSVSNIASAEATMLRLWWNVRVHGRRVVPKVGAESARMAHEAASQ